MVTHANTREKYITSTEVVAPRNLLSYSHTLVEAFSSLRRDFTPARVTDAVVIGLVNAAENQLASLASDNSVPSEMIRQHECLFRSAAQTLVDKASWLTEGRSVLETFISSQPIYLDRTFRFSVDFFSENISLWKRILSPLVGRPALNFLEVGSLEGMSACWLLQNILTDKTSTLTCIDTFSPDESGEIATDLDYSGDGSSLYARFLYNIKQIDSDNRVTAIRADSSVALRSLPLQHYDFIYIDGSHTPRAVLQDAVLSWPLLKDDALVIFDDYKWKSELAPTFKISPQSVLDAFLDAFDGEYCLLHSERQLVLKKGRQSSEAII